MDPTTGQDMFRQAGEPAPSHELTVETLRSIDYFEEIAAACGSEPFCLKTLVWRAVAALRKPPAMRADDNPLYKTTLPPDIDDCSGRQEFRDERV